MIGEPVRSPRVVSLAFAARRARVKLVRVRNIRRLIACCMVNTGPSKTHGIGRINPAEYIPRFVQRSPTFHVIGTDLATHSDLSGPPPQRSDTQHPAPHTAHRKCWPHSRRRDDVRVGVSRSLAAPPPRLAAGVVGLGNQCDGALAAGATRGPPSLRISGWRVRRGDFCQLSLALSRSGSGSGSGSRSLPPWTPLHCKRQSEPRRALETSLGKAFWQNHTSHHGAMHGPSSRTRPSNPTANPPSITRPCSSSVISRPSSPPFSLVAVVGWLRERWTPANPASPATRSVARAARSGSPPSDPLWRHSTPRRFKAFPRSAALGLDRLALSSAPSAGSPCPLRRARGAAPCRR